MDGRAFVVVGGTTGMGLSGAHALARAGANVVVLGRHEDTAQAALTQLGTRARAMVGDAIEPATSEAAITLCREEFGRFDGLYHVAGGSGRKMGDGPLHEITEEGWEFTFDLNLKSLFLSNRAAVRALLDQKAGGSILNMSSVLGAHPSIHHFSTHAYSAAKSAVFGFTRACAAYYAPHGIRFNCVCPALVETPMSRRAMGNDAILGFIQTKQPLTGPGDPSDLDSAVLFFLGEGSRAVTGQILDVDGGWGVSEGQIV